MKEFKEIYYNKASCSGCSACASICPRNAIQMVPDALGFLYPQIDNELCIECGLCEQVCNFKTPTDDSLLKTYIMRHVNTNELSMSRSGAAFVALSDVILEEGGVVYGAAFESDFSVNHIRAINKKERERLRGTKYVQSNPLDTFKQCKNDLRNGRIVLYTGTPCQIAGLKSYIGEKLSDNLFTIDLLCHGVPAPYIWRDFVKEKQKQYGKNIEKLSFRDKMFGWEACRNTFYLSDGTVRFSRLFSDYFYHKWICLRMTCKQCPFANLHRAGDVTIGDGWTWRTIDANFNKDDKGVSFIMVNTPKGEKLFSDARKYMTCVETEISKCMQDPLAYSVPFHKDRVKFERDYARFGYWYIRVRYLPYIFTLIEKAVSRIVKRIC